MGQRSLGPVIVETVRVRGCTKSPLGAGVVNLDGLEGLLDTAVADGSGNGAMFVDDCGDPLRVADGRFADHLHQAVA